MKRSLVCAVLMATAAVGGATACEPPEQVAINGSFWERGQDRTHLTARLAPGESKHFEISGQRSVEIARNKAGRSTIKLRDPKGNALHFAWLDSHDKPFRLAVCEKRIELASPATEIDTVCAARG
jgi:hypothetical protein